MNPIPAPATEESNLITPPSSARAVPRCNLSAGILPESIAAVIPRALTRSESAFVSIEESSTLTARTSEEKPSPSPATEESNLITPASSARAVPRRSLSATMLPESIEFVIPRALTRSASESVSIEESSTLTARTSEEKPMPSPATEASSLITPASSARAVPRCSLSAAMLPESMMFVILLLPMEITPAFKVASPLIKTYARSVPSDCKNWWAGPTDRAAGSPEASP